MPRHSEGVTTMKSRQGTRRTRGRWKRKRAVAAQQLSRKSSGGPAWLLKPEVCERTRLSDTTVWRLERQGLFPKRMRISHKRVAWKAQEVDDWIAAREAA